MADRRSSFAQGDNGDDDHSHIDLNENHSEENYWNGFRGLDPYTRMILGHETGGRSSSSMSNYIDLNDDGPGIVPGHEIGTGWPTWQTSATVGAEIRQHSAAVPVIDISAANVPHLSSYRGNSAMLGGGYDGTAGPSSGSHNNLQPHPLKREGPEDAGGVGIRIGASSQQRNVRQRFSSENQPNLSPAAAANSNHVQPPSESPHFVDHSQSSPSAYPTPNMQNDYVYDDYEGDVRPLCVLYPSGAERVDMGQTQTYTYPNFGFQGPNFSRGLDERFAEEDVPLSPIAGPFGPRYIGETSSDNQFVRNTGPVQGGDFLETPPIFGLNRRGEVPRYLGGTLMAESRSRQAGSNTGPARLAAPNVVAMPIIESVSDWLPTYLPALQPEPANWPPAHLAPAHQMDNNFTPITWDDFEEDEDEEEEDMPYDAAENMTYEELLALEDHMGNVDTGLTEETITGKLKQKKYSNFKVGPPGEEEICCICQEGYEEGATISRLSCRHEFHFDCIKQWLMRKNSCPICKKTALVI